jgi:hypothetical protein
MRKPKVRLSARNLAKGIRVGTLQACVAALVEIDFNDDADFAAAVQVAVAGAGFSAGELGRALGYDTGTIIKWYQGVMAPPRSVVRQEVVEVIKILVDRRLKEWRAARDSVDGIRKVSERQRDGRLSLRLVPADVDTG